MDDIILDIYFTIPSGYFNPLPSSLASSTLLGWITYFRIYGQKKVIKLSFNRYTMVTLKNWVTIYLQLVDTLFWEVASYLNSLQSALRRKHFAFWHWRNWFPNLQYISDMTVVRLLSMGCDTLHNRYLQLFNRFASIKAYRAFIFPLTIVNASSPSKSNPLPPVQLQI